MNLERQRNFRKKHTSDVGVKDWIKLGGLIIGGIKLIPKVFKKRRCTYHLRPVSAYWEASCEFVVPIDKWNKQNTYCPNCGRKIKYKEPS